MGKGKTSSKSTKKAAKQLTAEEALAKFEKPAGKLAPDRVKPCRADVALAHANARSGVTAVFGAADDPDREALVDALGKALPELSTKKVLELPDLGRALVLAAQRVAPASSGEIDEKLAVVSKHREPMLDAAEVLAKKGLLDKGVVAGIRAGYGKLDHAQDGLALADLYTQSAAAITGKHPFTAADVAELRAASEWLLDHLVPGGARKTKDKPTAAEDLRDRLWTLLLQRYGDLRVFGYWRFRDELDDHVPKLLSRALGPRGKPEDGDTAKPDGAGATNGAATDEGKG